MPAATVIAPVVVLSVIPTGQVPLVATVALPVVPSVAATPFTLSFAAILFIATPPVAGAVPFSEIAFAIAETTIVSVTVAQVCGVNLSHN